MASVFTKSLRDQKWQIVGFGIALAVIGALDVFIWPAYRDALQNLQVPPALQAFLGSDLSIATGPGFLSSEFFSWTPILLIVYAVMQGTGAIAGEEGSGTLDLLLSQPVARRDVLVQKVAATCLGSALMVTVGAAGFFVSVPFVDINVTLRAITMAMANMLPITLLFFALSLWLGSTAPSRGVAAGCAIGVVTAAYFVNTLANGVRSLDSLKYASPFYYYGAGLPLVRGISWPHVVLLLGVAATFVMLALRAFERRDVATGGGDIDVLGALRLRRGARLHGG